MLRENRCRILDAVESEHTVEVGEHGAPGCHDLPVLKILGRHIRVDPWVVTELALSQETLDVFVHCLLGIVDIMDTTIFLIRLGHLVTY